MSTDNRTELNDCNAATGWTGDGPTPATVTLTGYFYEGSTAIQSQHSNANEHMSTTEDSLNTGTFSINMSDVTCYLLLKDNLVVDATSGGVQFVLGDGTDKVGFDIAGNDAVGIPLTPFYNGYKLDVSNTPTGSNVTYAGTEGNLTKTAITEVGIGTLHAAKAQGNVTNIFVDYISYIANGSYALTINGGTAGTPETMADVAGDDVTNGWGMVSNPVGSAYYFFAPTEWGEATASANHYFTATDEQWFWLGDNGGGHTVGATHFPFRVIGNATDTGSFVITGVVITNTGTASEFDCSSSNVDTLEIDGCTIDGLASFSAPTSGGTSRFCTDTKFNNCGAITHNGASMNGCIITNSTVAADASSLVYNVNADPDGETDGMSFTKGAAAHHAIEFGTSAPTTMTIRDGTFSGFNASDANNDSTFYFADKGIDTNWTLNLVSCTGNLSYKKARAGDTVSLVINPVTTKFTIKDKDGVAIENARVFVETADNGGGSGFPFEAAVTSLSSSAGTATLTSTANHGLATNDYVAVRGAQPDEYNKLAQITVTGVNTFTYTVPTGISSPATGTINFSYAPIGGALSTAAGVVSSSKTWPAAQSLKGWARKKNAASPYYKDGDITVADASGGTDQTVILQPDE